MPKFMDVHDIGGPITPEAVAEIHAKDLAHQDAHGVKFIKYWLDEDKGKIFCLSESPSAEAHVAVHVEANGEGALPSDIYEVGEYS